jgi:tetratricopeptide (TPR) repeat protein
MHLTSRFSVVIAMLALVSASSVLASGSKEKTPEETASDNARKATSAYNDGVRKMEHADQVGLKGDATYAYNYRSASDGKVRHEYEQAVEDFEKAIKLSPTMKEAHNNLGYCYRKLGKLNASLSAYDKAIALDANFAQAREYRGETYLALDRLPEAEAELAFLQKLKSPYADELAQSIELYRHQDAGATERTGGR